MTITGQDLHLHIHTQLYTTRCCILLELDSCNGQNSPSYEVFFVAIFHLLRDSMWTIFCTSSTFFPPQGGAIGFLILTPLRPFNMQRCSLHFVVLLWWLVYHPQVMKFIYVQEVSVGAYTPCIHASTSYSFIFPKFFNYNFLWLMSPLKLATTSSHKLATIQNHKKSRYKIIWCKHKYE